MVETSLFRLTPDFRSDSFFHLSTALLLDASLSLKSCLVRSDSFFHLSTSPLLPLKPHSFSLEA